MTDSMTLEDAMELCRRLRESAPPGLLGEPQQRWVDDLEACIRELDEEARRMADMLMEDTRG